MIRALTQRRRDAGDRVDFVGRFAAKRARTQEHKMQEPPVATFLHFMFLCSCPRLRRKVDSALAEA